MKTITKETIDNYVECGTIPGDVITAVLSNNLTESIFRADEQNRADLLEIVRYIYNSAPSACWGSKEKVVAWLKSKGESGEKA
jgi:hypothetical protein